MTENKNYQNQDVQEPENDEITIDWMDILRRIIADYHYGREAIHNILYTIANSKTMNGGMPGSRYLAKVEPYQKVIYAVDGVCGGLIAVLVVLTILRFRKKKEDVKTV